MTTTVLLVDDHPVVRSGLRAVLDTDTVHVIGEAATGEEAITLAGHLHPDVVLCDLRLGAGIDGSSRKRVDEGSKTAGFEE